MQSISGIITQVRTSKGEVPPPLVGPSVTMAGDYIYVFGGRLVSTRKMTNQLYVMDVKTQMWTRHIPSPDSDKPPTPRYFHSANVHNNALIIFGGMGYARLSSNKDDMDGLSVLDDLAILDIDTMTWRRPMIHPSLFAPRARYAHLAEVMDDRLIVIGGQDGNNSYLQELNILDLHSWEWVQVKDIEKQVGAYRSIAISTPPGTRLPSAIKDNLAAAAAAAADDYHHQGTGNANSNGNNNAASAAAAAAAAAAAVAAADEPNPIYLYTNYNFTNVRRELQLVFMNGNNPSVEDCSQYMTGSSMPPGLRFPTGHTLGHHLILAGTYLSQPSQSYSIWSLNLGTLTWGKIETGTVLASGSWNRGVLHERTNRFLVFGNQHRNLMEDYNHRQTNFDHLAVVDLEAFGVYKLPRITCSTLAQEMGLSLLNEPAVSDFYIITRENQSIPINSAVVAQRWPYFDQLLEGSRTKQHGNNANNSKDDVQSPSTPRSTASASSATHNNQHPSSSNTTTNTTATNGNGNDNGITPPPTSSTNSPPTPMENGEKHHHQQASLEPVLLKSHSMLFPYPYPVVIALLQFIYTDNLLTAQQYQPHILAQLLLLADMYHLPRLQQLATHALHQMLNMSTAPLIFETAALSHQTSLQIRALKMMIAAKKMIQQQQMLQAGAHHQIQQPHPPTTSSVTSPPASASTFAGVSGSMSAASAAAAAAASASTRSPKQQHAQLGKDASATPPDALSPTISPSHSAVDHGRTRRSHQPPLASVGNSSFSAQQLHHQLALREQQQQASQASTQQLSPSQQIQLQHQQQQQLQQRRQQSPAVQQQYVPRRTPSVSGQAGGSGSTRYDRYAAAGTQDPYAALMNGRSATALGYQGSTSSMQHSYSGTPSYMTKSSSMPTDVIAENSPPSTPRHNTFDHTDTDKRKKEKKKTFFGGKLF
ncbi:hypothetical protein BC940DRAFT_369014 [Gongronella butleri]|nr:hypothetical protein BC940DRAFT_369014 [Gongronella butleri]